MSVGSILGGIGKTLGAIAPLALVLGPAGAALGAGLGGLGIVSAATDAAQPGTEKSASQANQQNPSSMGFEF